MDSDEAEEEGSDDDLEDEEEEGKDWDELEEEAKRCSALHTTCTHQCIMSKDLCSLLTVTINTFLKTRCRGSSAFAV